MTTKSIDNDMNTYRFEYYKDASDEWRWRLRHINGEIVADSSEGYKNEKEMLEGWHNITQAISNGLVTIHNTHYTNETTA